MSTDPVVEEESEELTEPVELDQEEVELATKYGWKSPDDWKGDPPAHGFMSPNEFLETPHVAVRVARDKAESLEATIAEIRADQEAHAVSIGDA